MDYDLLRRRVLLILTLVLLIATGIRYWPKKHANNSSSAAFRGPGGGPGNPDGPGKPPMPDENMRQRMEETKKNMTPEQRTAFETRIEQDRAFFDSVRNLPEDQRNQQIREHFAANPPPPGFPPPPDGGAGGGPPPGGPGPGGNFPSSHMHIPDPGVRHSMDQHIADSQAK